MNSSVNELGNHKLRIICSERDGAAFEPEIEKEMSASVVECHISSPRKAPPLEDIESGTLSYPSTSLKPTFSSKIQEETSLKPTFSSKIQEEVEEAHEFLQQQQALKLRRQRKQQQQKETCLHVLKFSCLCILTGGAIASSILVIQSCNFFSYQDEYRGATGINANRARMVLEENLYSSFATTDHSSPHDSTVRRRSRNMNPINNNIFSRNHGLPEGIKKSSQQRSATKSAFDDPECCGDYFRSKHNNDGNGNSTMDPSFSPMSSPTLTPTSIPSSVPVSSPTSSHSSDPTSYPTRSPSTSPTSTPTLRKTLSPRPTPSTFHKHTRGIDSGKEETEHWVEESSLGTFDEDDQSISHDELEGGIHNDAIESNSLIEGDDEPTFDSTYYSPFEDLSEATVGLFSYSLGEQNDNNMCFRYYDESTGYNLFRSNTTMDNSIDYWIVARYCSIFAPIASFLAVIQLVLEIMFCGSSDNGDLNADDNDQKKQGWEKFRKMTFTLWFVTAGLLQCGTFVVMFASPVLSASRKEQDGFCLSGSTIRCNMDTGAWLSLGSAIAYLIVASYSTKLWIFLPTANEVNKNRQDADEFSTDSSLSSLSMNSNYRRKHGRNMGCDYETSDNTIAAPSRTGSIRIPWHVRERLNKKKKLRNRGLFSLSSYRSGKRSKKAFDEEKTVKNDVVRDGACCYCVFLEGK
eukprot:jgi/Psemu1/17802/gm1.17802_g